MEQQGQERQEGQTGKDPKVHTADLTSRNNYTSDQLLQKFGSPFELINYAIRLAENLIKSGRAPRIAIGSENPALQVIAEIAYNKDQFEEIREPEPTNTFLVMSETRTVIADVESAKNSRSETPTPRKKQKVPL